MCLDNLKFENKNKNLFYTENIKNLSEHIFLKKKKKEPSHPKKKETWKTWNYEKIRNKLWKPFTCNSQKIRTFSTAPLQTVLYLALQLGRAFRVEKPKTA